MDTRSDDAWIYEYSVIVNASGYFNCHAINELIFKAIIKG